MIPPVTIHDIEMHIQFQQSISSKYNYINTTAPRIECDIRLPLWCIANFGGRIEMEENEDGRKWKLTDETYFTEGPLLIFEDKSCTEKPNPRKTGERDETDTKGHKYRYISYSMGNNGRCHLGFKFPIIGDKENPSYRQTIYYGMMACIDDNCKYQLYIYK
ncbi:hypothetical protein [Nitrospirillum sp. BR 11163]|uniref:hypothetical protein n=1 Tax=Nitrospirillum sp. BR 11163 TaxID=3104323 RepID=UPI002AFF030D|nr:hypothetical protein [Nitrospirillum sp. BR 11163]MEA1676221.1 hypothetical protein [Nitrospirillum sp. BR 11163]